jgi:hypothetical protein
MVLAILKGRKTQTRRKAPIRELNILQHPGDMITWSVSFLKAVKGVLSNHSGGKFSDLQARSIIASQFNPYGKPGDTLWVREGWRTLQKWNDLAPRHLPDDQDKIDYLADGGGRNPLWAWGKGRPSIHMPRWASRISLKVTDVKVERLQHISEADAIAEGVDLERYVRVSDSGGVHASGEAEPTEPLAEFQALWTSINGAESWQANPWVAVYTFERIKP